MSRNRGTVAVLALSVLMIRVVAAEEEPVTAEAVHAVFDVSEGEQNGADELEFVQYQPRTPAQVFGDNAVVRFGWWGVSTDGDKTKIGEYQDLKSSPFWDVDGLFSDGARTVDFFGTGLDLEGNQGGLRFYQPGLSANIEYDRYRRFWDHDVLFGTDIGLMPDPAANIITEDLNAGQDYAIRVQELKASVKGQITENVNWKLNLWGMKKSGVRQANAIAHCFDLDPAAGQQANTCHLLSQSQKIDWLTMEIEPVVEVKLDNFNVEYARTMRSFGQDDQIVSRTYTRFGFSPASGTGGPPFRYAFVPENFTQIDRLKISGELSEYNRVYASMYIGDTENKFRDTKRRFNGFDVRLTNRTFEDITLTGYAALTNETNDLPGFLAEPTVEDPADIRHPVEYRRTRTGIKSRWTPFPGYSSDFSVASGYEFSQIERDYAVYDGRRLGTFSQPDTKTHQIEFGPAMKWTSTIDTYARYKGRFTEDPIIGVRESTGRFNTNQPEQEHGLDVGGTFAPTRNFMASAQFSFVERWNHSMYPSVSPTNAPIDFTENDYPMYFTLWYAPTDRFSLTGGYAYFTNWIQQEISQGFRFNPVDTSQWRYEGTNQMVSLNGTYAWTDDLNLVGGVEWNRGNNSFADPLSTTGADWTGLSLLSDVSVETTRFNAGVDYQIRPGIGCYFRYNYFDYADFASVNSGTGHFFLAGARATY